MIRLSTLKSNSVGFSTESKNSEAADDGRIEELRRDMKESNGFRKGELDEHCEHELSNLMFELLDHVFDDHKRFWILEMLDASTFMIFAVHIK